MTQTQSITSTDSVTSSDIVTTPAEGDLVLDLSTHAGPDSPRHASVTITGDRDTSASHPQLWPQRILVASDDVVALAGLVDAVCAPQREVHSTCDDDLALDLALQLHFDLVILHLDRPGAGGTEVSHCIRTCHALHQPQIVVITRPQDEETWTKAVHCGADLVLPEAVSTEETTRALSALLR